MAHEAALELLEKGGVCQLALAARGEPYVVTLNYGFRDGVMYFHGAHRGRKMAMLAENPRVCFTVVRPGALVVGEKGCDYSMNYESAVGFGTARFVDGYEEKRDALGIIMAQYAPGTFSFDDELLAATAVFAVTVEELSGKRRS